VSYFRLGEIVIKKITVDNRGGSGGGCFRIEVRTDAEKLMNMIIASFETGEI